MLGKQLIQAAAGAAGAGGAGLYVDDVFSTFLYTGDNSVSTQTFNTGLDMSGEGGMIWFKSRSNSQVGRIIDTVRGTNESLIPSGDNSSGGLGSNGLTFLSNGFSLGWTGGDLDAANDYVSWSFRKAPGFFDVVTYTGTGSARTVAHNLGSVPGMIFIKKTSGNDNWLVGHVGITLGSGRLILNQTTSSSSSASLQYWNNTAATSTEFSVGTHGSVNANGATYVAYVFANDDASFGTDEDESIIKCGSYAGNGSSGQIIDLGFEAQWLMIKSYTRSGNGYGWTMADIMRDETIFADETGTSGGGFLSTSPSVRASANGFHLLNGDSNFNESGESYIYMAIRRPHKPPTAGTEVFKAVLYSGSGNAQSITGAGFAPDWVWSKDYGASNNGWYFDRLRGVYSLDSSGTGGEQDRSDFVDPLGQDGIDFVTGGFDLNRSGSSHVAQFIKRAPGFFDAVTYTGNGSAGRTIAHNLGSVPEMMIVKCRSNAEGWPIYHSAFGATKYIRLNSNSPVGTSNLFWNDTAPTSSVLTVGGYDEVNGSAKTYIAYLFATLPGISKVGSYTGTGNDINVDCGFSAGARYILLKRTDSSGDFFVYDSARGIVSGNDPYLLANSTAAQVAGTDYIDPLSSGFTVTSSAPTGLNASGGTYIFLAIA